MTARRALWLLLPVLSLSGCLQVEVNGPVTGAVITITPLRSGSALVSGLSTSTVAEARAQFDDNWAGWNDHTRLLFLGTAEIDGELFDANRLYLVTSRGGEDRDADSDRNVDSRPPALARPLHAIVTGAQLNQPLVRVNLLTEAIYQLVAAELDTLSNAQVRRRLKEYARKVVGDVNGDGRRNYNDVLAWSRTSNSPYLGDDVLLERMSRSLYDKLFAAEVLALDAENLVNAAGWHPADPDAPRAGRLVGCAAAVVFDDLCRFSELPLLGQAMGLPEVDDVMARVVVSHDWMAERFREVLMAMPDDLLLMFRSAAGIVIGADVRPSFYSGATAVIYLDGDYFWLSPEERAVISTEEDFRAAFASQVAFADLWRYVVGNERAYPFLDETDAAGNRQPEDLVAQAAVLLFHELAHAVDFFPPQSLDQFPPSLTPFDVDLPLLSDALYDSRPLRSAELFGVGQVLYFGAEPTTTEANYTPDQIGAFFDPDRASDLYAYASEREDLAMLFEEAMMYLHFGFRRDLAFTTVSPEGAEEIVCEDFQVGYGMRGRMAARQVLPRVKEVVAGLLPERSYNAELSSLPEAVPLNTGTDWCSSIQLDQTFSARQSLPGSRRFSLEDSRRPYR